MRKLTTKLLFAIISAAFALVALGTTTFAWFTLTNEATISKFNAEITAGEGIEISIDGTNYYTTIPTNIIQAEINKLKVTLKDITSPDGVYLYPLGDQNVTTKIPFYETPSENQTNQFIQFDLWVRSTTPTNVFIDTIDLSATSIDWLADTTFINAKGITVYPYVNKDAAVAAGVTDIPEDSLFDQQAYDASNALRMSFALYGATTAKLVYEKPVSDDNTVLGQNAIANGMVSYYLAKTGENLLERQELDENGEPVVDENGKPVMVPYNPTLPATNTLTTIDDEEETKSPFLLTTLTGEATDAYYTQKMTIRLWVEGWDPDTFNAILNAEIFARIVFTSDPHIEPESED
jgi:hypothetical protein